MTENEIRQVATPLLRGNGGNWISLTAIAMRIAKRNWEESQRVWGLGKFLNPDTAIGYLYHAPSTCILSRVLEKMASARDVETRPFSSDTPPAADIRHEAVQWRYYEDRWRW